jgi:hypothetical protein
MSDFSGWSWTLMAISAFFFGMSKTGIPGVGLLGVVIMATALPAKMSTGIVLPLLVLGDLFAIRYYHQTAEWRLLVRILPCAALGVAAGAVAMHHTSDVQLRPIIGGISMGMLLLNRLRLLQNKDAPPPALGWFSVVMGLIAGVTTMMANAAGPVMALYMLALRLPKLAFLGTAAWAFLLLNLFKLPFSAGLGLIHPHSLMINLCLAPLLVAGALIGIRVARRIPEKPFAILVEAMAFAGAIMLLAR